MSEDNQIVVPRSFIDLFMAPGKMRPSAPREHIAQRYEFCEDLAHMLCDTAREQLHALHVTESDVLERIRRGLAAGETVDARETSWVLHRLAEILGWPARSAGEFD